MTIEDTPGSLSSAALLPCYRRMPRVLASHYLIALHLMHLSLSRTLQVSSVDYGSSSRRR
jgi:hypothetical protein